jgi:hypothetical protein
MNIKLVVVLIICVIVFGLSMWGFVESYQLNNFGIGAGATVGFGLSLFIGYECVRRLRRGT